MLESLFKIDRADFFIDILTLLFVYLMSTPLIGIISSYIVYLMGDDTPKEEGFMSLNPLNHISISGLLLLLLIRIGFGRSIEVNPSNIRRPFRNLKLFIAYNSDGLGYFIVGFLSLFALSAFFGSYFLFYNFKMSMISAFDEMILRILYGIVYFCFFSSFINLIWGTSKALLVIGYENRYEYTSYLEPIMPIIPFLAILLLRVNFVANLVFKLIGISSLFISYII